MEPRITTGRVAHVEVMKSAMPYEPSISGELHKTGGLLARALEVAETLVTKVRGPAPVDGCGGKQSASALLEDAQGVHSQAGALCERLDELARLLG